MLGARDRVHRESRPALQQVHGLEVHPVDGVDLAGDEGVGAGGRVHDGDHLDLVEVPAAGVPVVRVPLQVAPHPRVEALDPVRARPDAGLPVGLAALAREDGKVVVAEDEREVGVSGAEGEDHGVLAVGLDVGDRFHDGLGGGLRVLAPVVVDGCDDVLGGDFTAVVEGHALTQLEGPGPDVGRRLPALRDLAGERAVRAHLRHVVVVPVRQRDHEAVLMGRRVEAVHGLAVRLAHAHDAALLGGKDGAERRRERHHASGARLYELAACRSGHCFTPLVETDFRRRAGALRQVRALCLCLHENPRKTNEAGGRPARAAPRAAACEGCGPRPAR